MSDLTESNSNPIEQEAQGAEEHISAEQAHADEYAEDGQVEHDGDAEAGEHSEDHGEAEHDEAGEHDGEAEHGEAGEHDGEAGEHGEADYDEYEEEVPTYDAQVTIVYLGPTAPHWDFRSDFGDVEIVEAFKLRVQARLLLLPPHDPQFRRNRERVNRDAESANISLAWDLGYEEETTD